MYQSGQINGGTWNVCQDAAIVGKVGSVLLGFLLLGIGACSSEDQEVWITLDDFRVTPTRVDVTAGQSVHLVVRNQGREPHRFQSTMFSLRGGAVVGGEGETVEQLERGLLLAPGQRVEAVLTLLPGLYHFRCPIRGHQGMNGIIVVQEPARSAS